MLRFSLVALACHSPLLGPHMQLLGSGLARLSGIIVLERFRANRAAVLRRLHVPLHESVER